MYNMYIYIYISTFKLFKLYTTVYDSHQLDLHQEKKKNTTTTFWPWAKQEHLGQTQPHSPHSFALKSSPMDASPGGVKG